MAVFHAACAQTHAQKSSGLKMWRLLMKEQISIQMKIVLRNQPKVVRPKSLNMIRFPVQSLLHN